MADILIGIQSGSGDPIFSENLSARETQSRVDAFSLLAPEVLLPTNLSGSATLKFSTDIMITKQLGDAFSTYYTYYQNVDNSTIESMLKHNYNMTTASVHAEFSNILNNITQELTPPKSSRAFEYDFKFSQNQNPSINTGSARPVRTRTARSSGGGGY